MIEAIAKILGNPPKLDGKNMMLKTQCFWITDHREFNLLLTWPYYLVFMVLEGA